MTWLKKLLGLDTDSETIWFARLQMIAAGLWAFVAMVVPVLLDAALAVDWSPAIGADWKPLYLFASGALTEILRRRRATDI